MTWRETIAKAGAYLQAKAVPDAQVAAVQTGSSMYCVKGESEKTLHGSESGC